MFTLPALPYAQDALEPDISANTIEYHYGKHHQTYVEKTNKLVQGTEFENAELEDIIRKASGGIFNNAAQVWNHSFYWNCLSPDGGGKPAGPLQDAIAASFGKFDDFKASFNEAATTLFGSGWVWLVLKDNDSLEIVQASNAGNPLRDGLKPLMTLDVWEHAYYLDYQNARPKYLEGFWNKVNWDFVQHNMG